jgi:hypothetical protein
MFAKLTKTEFILIAGLKNLVESTSENPSQPVLVGFLQKGSKKDKWLPGVHRPGKKDLFQLKY